MTTRALHVHAGSPFLADFLCSRHLGFPGPEFLVRCSKCLSVWTVLTAGFNGVIACGVVMQLGPYGWVVLLPLSKPLFTVVQRARCLHIFRVGCIS